jgi:carbamate kinase
MAGSVVVAMAGRDGRGPVDVPALAGSARSLVLAGWHVVLMTEAPGCEDAPAATLALTIGQSRAGRRAVPVVAHVLVDPADPALARPPAADHPEPLAILEAEAIASLMASFPVVVTAGIPVVPNGDAYRPVAVDLDPAASAQRLAGDLGAGVLAFVTAAGDVVLPAGEIDVVEAERLAAGGAPLAAELSAAARFVRAGGELAIMTPPERLAAALDDGGDGVLRIRRTVARPRSEAPALAAGWC